MNEHTSSRLRYVHADQLDPRVLDLDGLDVRNVRDDHIGDVEGLLIDSVSGRPRYLVIDSGGWFSSRKFLLPIAHARLDEDRRALRVEFDKETINRFPEMRSDRYEALTDEELQSYDEGVWRTSGVSRPTSVDSRGDYNTSPTWWNSAAWANMPVPGAASGNTGRSVASEEIIGRPEDPVRARAEREQMIAHEREDSFVDRARGAEMDRDDLRHRDDLRAAAVGERAQPGDILGIESAGETTSIGDTAEDEDKRRERAEKDIRGVRIEPDDTIR